MSISHIQSKLIQPKIESISFHFISLSLRLFTQNLKVVDAGVKDMYNLFEKIFNHDGKTSYIFTADHGMTDRGSHGGGLNFETETPFLAWGAGIKKDISSTISNKDEFLVIGGEKVHKYNIEQASVASLMATLIGVAVPVNNVGKLPDQFLDVSEVSVYLFRSYPFKVSIILNLFLGISR